MNARLSRHRTPSGMRREILPALLPLIAATCFAAAAPLSAHAQGAGADSLQLTWTAPGDDGNVGTATGYEMRRSLSAISESNWASATLVSGAPNPRPAGTTQSMVVRGLTNGVTYYFAIKAVDEAGNTAPLSNVLRWDWILDTAPPAAPSGIAAAVENSGARVRLTWAANAEPDLASYAVYRSFEPGGPFDLLAAGVSGTQYLDTDIPAGTAGAWYEVTASDQSGNESARSASVSATLSSSAPATAWNLNPAYPNPGSVSTPVNIPVDVPPSGAGSAQLQIMDASGHLIRRLELSPQPVVWDGRNQAGQTVAPGVYTAWLVGGDAARSIKIVRVP